MKVNVFVIFLAGFIALLNQASAQNLDRGKNLSRHEASMKNLENLGKIHNYNETFDNYQLGGMPYEEPSPKKEEK